MCPAGMPHFLCLSGRGTRKGAAEARCEAAWRDTAAFPPAPAGTVGKSSCRGRSPDMSSSLGQNHRGSDVSAHVLLLPWSLIPRDLSPGDGQSHVPLPGRRQK